MKPINFEESNITYAEDQPEYLPLPVFKSKDPYGTVVSCWKLTWKERFKVFFLGVFWFSQMTFGQPLQPQLPMAKKPDWIKKEI